MVTRKTKEQFIQEASLLHNDKYSYEKIVYVDRDTKMIITCSIHGDFLLTPRDHLSDHGGKRGCKKCAIEDRRYKEAHCVDQHLVENNIQIKRIGKYVRSKTKIEWECLNCKYVWGTQPRSIVVMGTGCPKCARGKNENRVGEALQTLGIENKKIRIDLSIGKRLYPDYFLPQFNTIIEYNGQQHYEPVFFGNWSKDEAENKLRDQQYRDNLLMEYCKENNINLLEIDGRKYKGNKLKNFVSDYFAGQLV
jgi:hypothetical protein